jgi:hypothetical protein
LQRSIEFFTKSIWDTIPESWKEPLLALSDEEAAAFVQGTFTHFIPVEITLFRKGDQKRLAPIPH